MHTCIMYTPHIADIGINLPLFLSPTKLTQHYANSVLCQEVTGKYFGFLLITTNMWTPKPVFNSNLQMINNYTLCPCNKKRPLFNWSLFWVRDWHPKKPWSPLLLWKKERQGNPQNKIFIQFDVTLTHMKMLSLISLNNQTDYICCCIFRRHISPSFSPAQSEHQEISSWMLQRACQRDIYIYNQVPATSLTLMTDHIRSHDEEVAQQLELEVISLTRDVCFR